LSFGLGKCEGELYPIVKEEPLLHTNEHCTLSKHLKNVFRSIRRPNGGQLDAEKGVLLVRKQANINSILADGKKKVE
jgi:hypothetical protein